MKRSVLSLSVLLCVFTLCVASVPAAAQRTERDSAFILVDQGKTNLALPILERLAASNPNDALVQERLGLSLLKASATVPDADGRRQQRVRARAAFEAAVRLGAKSQQTIGLLASIPPDGGNDPSFSSNPQVNEAMRSAEQAYSSGDYRQAFTLYQKALALDPNLYEAALFSGDTYVHTPAVDSAYPWYARATQINPDRETAWRYWSDVLLKQGKLDEARDKAIQAIIAEPYSRFSRSAISEWAGKAKVVVSFPRIDLPAGTPAKPASAARAVYDSVRLAWKGNDGNGGTPFKTTFPAESAYRHSVAEERAALRAAYEQDPTNIATSNVKNMDDAGVLEAFILIVVADAGIATEYQNYRRAFRDVLQKFWVSFVIGAPYSK